MGAVAAVLGDAAPFQSSERSGAANFCQPRDLASGQVPALVELNEVGLAS
jgi:hypothetical protein